METDIPNIYAKVSSFSDYSLNSNSIEIPVSAEGKKLVVTITPDSKLYGPGETATVNVLTTDVGGNPLSADVALWEVDKAIFELSDNRLGNIFDTFWFERGLAGLPKNNCHKKIRNQDNNQGYYQGNQGYYQR